MIQLIFSIYNCMSLCACWTPTGTVYLVGSPWQQIDGTQLAISELSWCGSYYYSSGTACIVRTVGPCCIRPCYHIKRSSLVYSMESQFDGIPFYFLHQLVCFDNILHSALRNSWDQKPYICRVDEVSLATQPAYRLPSTARSWVFSWSVVGLFLILSRSLLK